MAAKKLWGPGKPRHLAAFAGYLGLSNDYWTLHDYSIRQPKEFWAAVWDHFRIIGSRGEHILSYTPGSDLCDAEWFRGTTLNYAENVLDLNPRPGRTSISFVSEEGARQDLSYEELRGQVLACAAALRASGIGKGDVVAGWMSNCPHSIIAMLGSTYIGAVWSSCSPDFGAEAVLDRFSQIKPKLIFTHDYYSYKGKKFIMEELCQKVVARLDSVQQLVRVPFLDSPGNWAEFLQSGGAAAGASAADGRGGGADTAGEASAAGGAGGAEQVDFNHPLFIMFSSGTTGKPKCIVHSHGGVLLKHASEQFLHTDLTAEDSLFYFTTCGWMMWNWLVSGLLCGSRLVLYDGNPFYPDASRLLQLFSDEQVTVAGVSAKLIEGLNKAGVTNLADASSVAGAADEPTAGDSGKTAGAAAGAADEPTAGDSGKTAGAAVGATGEAAAAKFDLSKLRMLCSTGSPLSATGYEYVYSKIKRDLCLASISGGTDIIGCFVTGTEALPVYAGEIQAPTLGLDTRVYQNQEGGGVAPAVNQKLGKETVDASSKPRQNPALEATGAAQQKQGIEATEESAEARQDQGHEVIGERGELVCCNPFPSVPVGFLGDDEGKSKLRAAYFARFKGVWTHGDYAERTAKGGFIIHGRSDNTLNPGGVRIGTAEIYRQVEKLEQVADSIAVGQNWEDDTRIILFVVLQANAELDDELRQAIRQVIRANASPRHVPAKIIQVADLPRTISGKLSEEAVRRAMHNLPLNNLGALANPESLEQFKNLPQLQS